MKTPFVRIREKNKQIKELSKNLQEIATVLSCQPIQTDIISALAEALSWRGSYGTAMAENDALRVKMQEVIKDEVGKVTFSVKLENEKLKVEVEKLRSILDTKDSDLQNLKQRITSGNKGFWDFLYKLFKLN
jgi:hypothetical protein